MWGRRGRRGCRGRRGSGLTGRVEPDQPSIHSRSPMPAGPGCPKCGCRGARAAWSTRTTRSSCCRRWSDRPIEPSSPAVRNLWPKTQDVYCGPRPDSSVITHNPYQLNLHQARSANRDKGGQRIQLTTARGCRRKSIRQRDVTTAVLEFEPLEDACIADPDFLTTVAIVAPQAAEGRVRRSSPLDLS